MRKFVSAKNSTRRRMRKHVHPTRIRSSKVPVEPIAFGQRQCGFEAFRAIAPHKKHHQISDKIDLIIVRQLSNRLLHTSTPMLPRGFGTRKSMSCKIISRRQRLSRVEADRITRLLRALSQGIDVFGNGELAAKWLLSSLPELSNLRPIDVLYSKAGYERVRDLLDRITFGLGV
ncbi:hypothetical protein C0Z18_23120 [Trinickia dabaoshanensis]|uniref:Antitoxin Xre/MbcA/ParS-like toxin-binding domain-containing protein n=2 Tax=Trinickia dabaoshanensis TaxID=564714 RepID=A0A2N7VH43_9BURK|nr:hypothetical protein C0Z18_23120 [Trinickia dabaoshanensis]